MTDVLDRVEALDSAIREGRLTRKAWRDKDDAGRERVCLLLALVPEVGNGKNYTACPAELLPEWLARLTPSIDDEGSVEAWPDMVREYARLVRASVGVMTPESWTRLDFSFRAIAVREARSHVKPGDAALPAIDGVLALLDRAASGEQVDAAVWAAASAALSAAASADAWAAASAALSAAASADAWAAASAALSAAASADAWAAASAALSAAASAAAWDRVTAALFAVWQSEIERMEATK